MAIRNPIIGGCLLITTSASAAAVVGRPDASIDPSSLREQLSTSLSSYKIPTRMIVVDSIPRNAIGKALRREMAQQLAPESRSPSTPTEEALLSIWRKVLRRNDIGVTDNVFQFGADPLRAALASGFIDAASGVQMSTKVLYANNGARASCVLCCTARTAMTADCLSRRMFGSCQRPKSGSSLAGSSRCGR